MFLLVTRKIVILCFGLHFIQNQIGDSYNDRCVPVALLQKLRHFFSICFTILLSGSQSLVTFIVLI